MILSEKSDSIRVDQNDLILRALSLGYFTAQSDALRYRFKSLSSSLYRNEMQRFELGEEEVERELQIKQLLSKEIRRTTLRGRREEANSFSNMDFGEKQRLTLLG
mmetsp:Transcript_17356/g.29186  ORF Transcript_17356/g.29186 Transcript_17356/m.29186 type:complete len:105 (+) Transcript_17356:22-336(+)